MKTFIYKIITVSLSFTYFSPFAFSAPKIVALKGCPTVAGITSFTNLHDQMLQTMLELKKRGFYRAAETLSSREPLLLLSLSSSSKTNPNQDFQEALQILHGDLHQQSRVAYQRQTDEMHQLFTESGDGLPADDPRSLELHAQTVSTLNAIEEQMGLRNSRLTAQEIEAALIQIRSRKIKMNCE